MAGIIGPDGERFLWVMDPMTRKLRVPMSLIEPTQATAIPGTVPSLCMLFLDGRCRHPACRQVHISMSVLQQLRKEAQQAPNCCGAHGDSRDRSLLTDHYSFLAITGPATGARGPASPPSSQSETKGPSNLSGSTRSGGGTDGNGFHLLTLPVERVAMTVGLQRHIAQTHPLPPPAVSMLKSPGLHPAAPPAPQQPIPLSQVALQQYNQQFPPLSGELCPRPAPSKDTSSSSTGTGDAPLTEYQTGHPCPGELEPTVANTLEIPLKMVCRLHLSKKCRYLEDCNNVHICREFECKLPPQPTGGSQGPQHNAETLQAIRSATTAITMGSTTYNVVLIAPNSITDTEMHQLVTTHKQSYPQLQLRIVDVRSLTGSPPPPLGGSTGKKDDTGDGLSSAGSPSPKSPHFVATQSPLQSGVAVPFDCPPPPFLKGQADRPLAPPLGAPFQAAPAGPAATGMNNNSSIVASLLTGNPIGSPPPESSLPPHAQSAMKSMAIPVSPQRGSQGHPPLYVTCQPHLPPPAMQFAGSQLPPPAYTQLPPGMTAHATYGGAPPAPAPRRQ